MLCENSTLFMIKWIETDRPDAVTERIYLSMYRYPVSINLSDTNTTVAQVWKQNLYMDSMKQVDIL